MLHTVDLPVAGSDNVPSPKYSIIEFVPPLTVKIPVSFKIISFGDAKRADGNPNTYAFIVSPEMAVAYAISGRLSFNPEKDTVKDKDGNDVMLTAPLWDALPKEGFVKCDKGLITPPKNCDDIAVKLDASSSRLQILKPSVKWDGSDIIDADLLIKTKGKCTTDHISMAGPWLKFRGHLENISDNMLMGAVNAFNDETNKVKNKEGRMIK